MAASKINNLPTGPYGAIGKRAKQMIKLSILFSLEDKDYEVRTLLKNNLTLSSDKRNQCGEIVKEGDFHTLAFWTEDTGLPFYVEAEVETAKLENVLSRGSCHLICGSGFMYSLRIYEDKTGKLLGEDDDPIAVVKIY